jgi:hypothetical protein
MSASLFLSDAAFAHVERIWALTHVPRERRLNSWNMMSQIQKPRGLFPVDRALFATSHNNVFFFFLFLFLFLFFWNAFYR